MNHEGEEEYGNEKNYTQTKRGRRGQENEGEKTHHDWRMHPYVVCTSIN